MKIKTLYSVKYTVNEDKTAVTAVATVERFDKVFYKYNYIISQLTGYKSYELDKVKFVGVARFKNGDINNIEEAKKIARWKALRQGNSFFKRLAFDWVDVLRTAETELSEKGFAAIHKCNEYDWKIIKAIRKED